jgi:hypothetical protein
VYRAADLKALLRDLQHRVVVHTQIYPGYDNFSARHPSLGSALRTITHSLEGTPLRIFGLSHLLVVEKTAAS